MVSLSKLLIAALIPLAVGCSEPQPPTITLYRAVHAEDLDQIKRNLHWGADVNALDPDGRTPLHVAAAGGDWVIVSLLLDHGADPNLEDRDGATPLERAVLKGRTQVAEKMLGRGARIDPERMLFKMVEQGVDDRDVLRFLLAQGARIDVRNAAGDTPLLIALRAGERVIARRLVNAGADVNARTEEGRSALEIARASGVPELVELLERNGAR